MKVFELASEALQLDPNHRILLAKVIWESLEDPYLFGGDLSDEESARLAIQRYEEIERGKIHPLNHSEVKHSELRTCLTDVSQLRNVFDGH